MKQMNKLGFFTVMLLCLLLIAGLAACDNISDLIDSADKINGNVDSTDDNGDIDFKTANELKTSVQYGKYTIRVSEGAEVQYMTFIQNTTGCFFASYETPADVLDGSLVILNGSGYKWYQIEDGKRTFLYESQNDDDATQFFGNIIQLYFASHAYYAEDDFHQKSTATVAGRDCTVYSYSYSWLDTSIEWDYYVDDATGVCLKYIGSANDSGERGSFVWETTELVLGEVSLEPYISLPLNGAEEGPVFGNSSTWPTAAIITVADFFSDDTIPAPIGADSFEYAINSGYGTVTIEGISEQEYLAYRQSIESAGYEFDTDAESLDDALAYKEFAESHYVEISFSYEDGSLVLNINVGELS
ncbi:MAG: hypothetical protein EOM87_08865 [Clostridia bacterium]|nr:hypothetical protein [Clostridia bacterium]